MATKSQFHSFCRLVRLMHNTQQESYAKGNTDKKLVAKSKELEKKLTAKFREYPTGAYHSWYEWQEKFISKVKQVRAEQELYYSTRYDEVKLRCRKWEAELQEMIKWLEDYEPQVFRDETPVQATLL